VLEVQVDRPGVPVVLLLQSRWAIRWKIIEGEGTKIAALLVSAENGALSIEDSTTQYYGIPKLVYSPVMGKTANCNRELFARAVESLAKVPSMADVAGAASPEGAWTLSGEPIVIKEARTPEERGEPLPPPPAPPHDPDRLLTVSELLEQGYMRKVTEKDIRFFLRERRPNMRKYDGMVRMLTFDTYTDVIVLRDMTLPVNQQKARDLRYIVPRGVPEPSFAVPGFQIAFVDAECDAQGCRP
jgi:hypothetical protein